MRTSATWGVCRRCYTSRAGPTTFELTTPKLGITGRLPGRIALARRLEQPHPERAIIFGGLSATLFAEELRREHPEDYRE